MSSLVFIMTIIAAVLEILELPGMALLIHAGL
jgi:hypothetical protein